MKPSHIPGMDGGDVVDDGDDGGGDGGGGDVIAVCEDSVDRAAAKDDCKHEHKQDTIRIKVQWLHMSTLVSVLSHTRLICFFFLLITVYNKNHYSNVLYIKSSESSKMIHETVIDSVVLITVLSPSFFSTVLYALCHACSDCTVLEVLNDRLIY